MQNQNEYLEYLTKEERQAKRVSKKNNRTNKRTIKKSKRITRKKINKEKAQKFIQKTGFKLLLPFKPVMRKILDSKNINYNNKISDIATKFYELITGKKIEKLENLNGVEYIIDDIIQIIISTVMGFFKASKEKKDQLKEEGKAVPPMIESAGNAYTTTYNTVKDAATEEIKLESFPYLAVGVGGLIFLAVITNKK